jgi:DNA mismatch endonuclease (patch repair protein)
MPGGQENGDCQSIERDGCYMVKSLRTKAEQRRYNMSRIRSKNTKIELDFRKALWIEGIRYRKNYNLLPGNPDIAITKYKVAIFCDGEFWHGKDWEAKKCKIHSNKEYWIAKIEKNMSRDRETDRRLRNMNWTVLRFWGNDIRKNITTCVEEVKEAIFQSKMDLFSETGGWN